MQHLHSGACYLDHIAAGSAYPDFDFYALIRKNGQNCRNILEKADNNAKFGLEKRTIIPIEVKSGKDYYVHSALDNVMDVQNYSIKRAVVLCNENLSEKGSVLNIPIYMIMFFKKSDVSIEEFKLDINALLE